MMITYRQFYQILTYSFQDHINEPKLLDRDSKTDYIRSVQRCRNVFGSTSPARPTDNCPTMAKRRNIQLWLPNVPEHNGRTYLQRSKPIPDLSVDLEGLRFGCKLIVWSHLIKRLGTWLDQPGDIPRPKQTNGCTDSRTLGTVPETLLRMGRPVRRYPALHVS